MELATEIDASPSRRAVRARAVGLSLLVAAVAGLLYYKLGGSFRTLANAHAIGTIVALPTFFEIPIAALLLQLGAPPAAAIAFLIAGPIVNLPSLLVLARETSPRVAVSLATAVFLVSALAGRVGGI
jgi:uncharacterized membrane protein YraQ (UPF0718 family)